ncbi:hypothetical protein DdX_17332 [Ditylenchus destructor]|uniref:Uncharacterized protein n=1 Tax=Ditylenchus destructor TaxID=166010 RepID=A0AAD4MLL3_9BILA|nr:hypothetical protein DdX_17332 [Ditylenchus destructor]
MHKFTPALVVYYSVYLFVVQAKPKITQIQYEALVNHISNPNWSGIYGQDQLNAVQYAILLKDSPDESVRDNAYKELKRLIPIDTVVRFDRNS